MMNFKNEQWWHYLDEAMKKLIEESWFLLEREEQEHQQGLMDYSFVVFPVAKAYEGFLKKVLFDAGLITDYQLRGRHFRIGRSLNPDLPIRFRDEDWLFDDLDSLFSGNGEVNLARNVWEAWSKGRNRVFHYFTDQECMMSLVEARDRLELFMDVFQRVVGCRDRGQLSSE